MENNENKYYITASNSFDIVMFSENEEKREEYKNNIIRFYETTPKFKEAVDKVYEEKKEEYKDKKNTEEYGRLLGIGNKIGLEKKHNNSVEDFSSCSEEFDKQFGCCNSDRYCLIA